MNKKILLINAGSSSIKFQLIEQDSFKLIADGVAEAIGLDIGKFKITYDNHHDVKNLKFKDFKNALNFILDYFNESGLIKNQNEIIAIGHRVVHDGGKTNGALEINENTIKLIEENAKFAPLHNPFQLEVIELTKYLFPNTLQVACFDTGFHHTIPKHNYLYAVKKEWIEKYNIRKFGFHGLSYEYVNLKMQKILNKEKNNLIVCHLGSGCSICYIKDSLSYFTSMGFATSDGLVMCTRPGDISVGIIKYLCNELKMNVDQLGNVLLRENGLKGMTGYSDMRLIQNDLDNEDNLNAFNLFVDRIVNYICIGINQLDDNVDAIVFTAGIGENSSVVRQAIIDRIKIKKLKLDQTINNKKVLDYAKISTANSDIAIYAMKTNEEFIMAKYVKALMNK